MPETWVTLDTLCTALICSERFIGELKQAGVIKAGEHFYVTGKGGTHGKRVYHLEAIRAALLKRTAEGHEAEQQRIMSQETVDVEHVDELTKKNRGSNQ